MNICCSHCNHETSLRRPKETTIYNIQCYLCKRYFCYLWTADNKFTKPKEIQMKQGLNDCKPCTVKHEIITEEKGRYSIHAIFIKTFLIKERCK